MKIVVLGLSLSSSWGNGHATTYRAVLRALAARGHQITFLERDVPWYGGAHRDMPDPGFCALELYRDLAELDRWQGEVEAADAVIVGSYVPDGVEVGRWAQRTAAGVVAFYDIDTPVTLAALARNDCGYLTQELIPGYDLYLSFSGGPTLAHLEEDYGAKAARTLYCSVDAQTYRPVDVPHRWSLSYLGTYSADRQPALDALLVETARQAPDLRFAVAGPQYPSDIAWPGNVERLQHVPPREHPAFYGASRFTLNVTRRDMIAAGYSPSVRLFEAAACGTPIISDYWQGLDELIRPDTEIVIARAVEDVLVALRMPERERAAMAAAARRRVLAGHTAEHRAAELEQRLLQAAASMGDAASLKARNERLAPLLESRTTKHGIRERWRMKNGRSRQVLVAGGGGFLGSHLCERIVADGMNVVCLDNFLTGHFENLGSLTGDPRFELVEHDIIDPLPASLARCQFELIFNLACAASPPLYQADPEHTLMTSIIGTRNLLHLAATTGARLLMASTSEIYGDPDIHPQVETYTGNVNCTGPRACYDEGKRAAESLCFDYDRLGRAEVRVARIFNTYGPRLRASDGRVVSSVVSQAVAGNDITIHGDGSQTRSFCYVEDLTEGLVRLSLHEGPQPGPVNLGNPTEITIRDLVGLVLDLTGSRSKVVHLPLPTDDPRRRRPDIGKAAHLLDWLPATSLERGLRLTIKWFEELQGADKLGQAIRLSA